MGRLIPVSIGALLLVGAAAGLVIVPEHKPGLTCPNGLQGCLNLVPSGWSHSAYDAARIGTWALLIVGTILLVIGLINYARPLGART
jgi:hypothetical protein